MAKLNVPIKRLVATPGALETIRRSIEDNEHTDELAQAKLHELVGRHARGDWGEVCKSDAKLNDEAAVTTVLLPEDY